MAKRVFLTLGEAAKSTGKSKATISQAIKSGKLSVYAKTDKGYQIDPSELFRVYDPVEVQTVQENREKPDSIHSLYQGKIELLERIITEKDNVINDLRTRLDNESQERKKLTAILTDQQFRYSKKWWQFWKKPPPDS